MRRSVSKFLAVLAVAAPMAGCGPHSTSGVTAGRAEDKHDFYVYRAHDRVRVLEDMRDSLALQYVGWGLKRELLHSESRQFDPEALFAEAIRAEREIPAGGCRWTGSEAQR